MNTWIARNLYFGVQQIRREPIKAVLRDVQRSENASLDELHALQAQRQVAQLRFAQEHVPYYRIAYAPFKAEIESATTWESVNTLMNLLPRIDSDYVRQNATLFLADNLKELNVYPDKTSGSSGTPLMFPCDQLAWAYRHALMFRQFEWYNVMIGEPYVYIYGLHWSKRARIQLKIRDTVLNRSRISAYEISPETADRHLKIILDRMPTHLVGYPQAIFEICQNLYNRGLDQLKRIGIKAVFCSGEPLLEYQRSIIESVTGAPCVNQYGSAEGGLTACECPSGSLHLNIEATWFQTLNTHADLHEVIVTDMFLRAFPLIKYVLGDEVRLSHRKCDCGRNHPIIETVVGRSGEPITLPNGRVINSHLPGYIFKPLASLGVIRRYRFVYKKGEPLCLYIITNEGFTSDHLQLISEETKKAFGSDIELTIQIVDQIPTLANAKHKSFVIVEDE